MARFENGKLDITGLTSPVVLTAAEMQAARGGLPIIGTLPGNTIISIPDANTYYVQNVVSNPGAFTLKVKESSQADGAAALLEQLTTDQFGYLYKLRVTAGALAWTRRSGRVLQLMDEATLETDLALADNSYNPSIIIARTTLGGNRTLAVPINPLFDGQVVRYEFRQDGSGNRTITLGAGFALGTDISGVTLTTTANKTDVMTAVYDKPNSRWLVVDFVKGY